MKQVHRYASETGVHKHTSTPAKYLHFDFAYLVVALEVLQFYSRVKVLKTGEMVRPMGETYKM